ncbi:tubulin-specific chaperone C-like [Paramacrobiotus metropolitanus]|uniref:tubulin-specific chaperone C-like n=1 Tax=Paramacrobiotus metropolitanus TaxID=2943436 RepID=UPI0024464B8F|nr:tubulin-specific chaperone C-like [Paramacrobiotus metropolitanus]
MVVPDSDCDSVKDILPSHWEAAGFGSPCKSGSSGKCSLTARTESCAAPVENISDNLKRDLTSLEKSLQGLNPSALSKGDLEVAYQKAKTELERLNGVFVDAASYIPAYDQRFFQSHLQNTNKLLSEKLQAKKSGGGFSFRKGATAPASGSEVKPVSEIVVDQNLVSPVENGAKLLTKSSGECHVPSVSDSVKNGSSHLPAATSEVDSAFSCGFSNVANSKLRLPRKSLTNKDVNLTNMNSCEILLESGASTVYMNNLRDCTIICGPVRTSVFIAGCCRCTIVAACQQLRVHNSSDLQCYVHLASAGIIENTTNAQFGPYTLRYDGLEKDFEAANLAQEENNNWQNVQDFDYVVSKKRSPNVRIIPESERAVFKI